MKSTSQLTWEASAHNGLLRSSMHTENSENNIATSSALPSTIISPTQAPHSQPTLNEIAGEFENYVESLTSLVNVSFKELMKTLKMAKKV